MVQELECGKEQQLQMLKHLAKRKVYDLEKPKDLLMVIQMGKHSDLLKAKHWLKLTDLVKVMG